MKKVLFLIVFISFVQINFAQETDAGTSLAGIKPKGDITTVIVNDSNERKPSKGKFYDYIYNNYHLPNVPGLKGKVIVTFVINEDGSIDDFKIVEDLGYGTGEELIRVLKTTGKKWKPAMKDGKPVKYTYRLPLDIVVNE